MTYLFPILKVIIVSCVIVFTSWLAQKKPALAGFIIALPIASMLALMFTYAETKDSVASITFAKSILTAVPISYLFFLPFFLSEKLKIDFIGTYILGVILLILGYYIHQYIMKLIS
jgi:hypothetical protein